MFWLQIVSGFIKILREGQSPAQVAGGFALGSLVGLSPGLSLQAVLIWLMILALDVNLSAALVSFMLFSILGAILDPLFHLLGYALLVDFDALHPFWTALYNAPLAPLTRFNNTIVLGSLAGGTLLFIPVYYGMKTFVVMYRERVGQKVARWKIYQILSKNALVRWYKKVRDVGGLS